MENPESQPERPNSKDIFVAVLGGGLEKRKGRTQPVFDEKTRIIAGLKLVEQRGANHLIFSGGHAYREAQETVAEYSDEYAHRRDYNEALSPRTVEITHNNSLNTVKEFEDLNKLKKENPQAHFIVVSSNYHQVARDLCKENDFEFASAEDILLSSYNSEPVIKAISAIKGSPLFAKITESQKKRSEGLNKPFGRIMYKIASDSSLPTRAILHEHGKPDYS